MSVFVSTACLKENADVISVLETYDRIGLKDIEIGSSHQYLKSLEGLRDFDFNYLIHNYFPPLKEPIVINLASQDTTILKKSMELVKNSIKLSNSLNSETYSFHAGYRIDPDMDFNFDKKGQFTPYEKAFNTFMKSVKEINTFAEDYSVKIAVENNALSENNVIHGSDTFLLMCKYEEFDNIFKENPSDNLGALLDLGHLQINSHWLNFDKTEFIDKIKNKVFVVHVHENNGKNDEHGLIREDSWGLEIIKQNFSRKIPIVIESSNLNENEILDNKKLLETHVKKGM